MIDRSYNPDLLNSFLDYLDSALDKSQNTIKEYNYDLVTFFKYLKLDNLNTNTNSTSNDNSKEIIINDITINDLKKITLEDLYTYTTYLKNIKKNTAATRARKVASLKSFFNYLCINQKLLDINPAQNLETPKIGKRLPKYLTLEESRQLLNNVEKIDSRNELRDYAIITLFLNCGMRLSELTGININDIDFENNKLNVIGKGNKERTIYLNKACVDAINKYISDRSKSKAENKKENPLFLSERKTRISQRTVQDIVKKYLTATGLSKYSTHKLRHTAATLMYKYGNVDIRALQQLLGHESISTTEIYTHVDNEIIRNAVEANPLSNYDPKNDL